VTAANNALLLNFDGTPIKVITWQRAFSLIVEGRAMLVEAYDRVLRSVSEEFLWPAVVRLTAYRKLKARVRFNRANVLARDGYTCQYCGAAPRSRAGRPLVDQLTIDHVVPRAQAVSGRVTRSDGKVVSITCWENVVCACETCNLRKADRTPAQAGMPLLRRVLPKAPQPVDVLRMSLYRSVIPTQWKDYLPESAGEWAGYWTDELEEG
jgi:5-methylcytosine-specific restriction endonuclease McrA